MGLPSLVALLAAAAFAVEAPRAVEAIKPGLHAAPGLQAAQLVLPLEPLTAVIDADSLFVAAPAAQAAAALPAAALPAARALGAELRGLEAGGAGARQALDRSFENARAAPAQAQDAVAGAAGASPAALQPHVPRAPAAKPSPPAPGRANAPKTLRLRERANLLLVALATLVNPARALMPATAAPDASFLVQSAYGYKRDPAFVEPMAEAIAASAGFLKEALAKGERVSPRDVKEMMNYVARVRQDIAAEKGDRDWHNFGNEIPEDEDAPHSLIDPDGSPMPRDVFTGATTIDFLNNDPADRHYPFFWEAALAQKRQHDDPKGQDLVVDGVAYPVSLVHNSPWRTGALMLVHPNFSQMTPMRRKAFEVLASAISDRGISEARFMDRLALSYQLLVHATPWVRGSPSIIESYFDAALRAKFGKTLPPKTGEPFWDAALRDPRLGPYTGRDFLKNFGGA